jgi:hypothetical protein
MSEAEIMQGMIGSIQVIMSLFAIFFTLTSGYIAALYFFLHRAPFMLRLLAFALLSVGLVFLGGSAAVQQRIQEGLFAAWEKLPSAAIKVQAIRNPLALPFSLPLGANMQDVGIVIGWVTAISVYLALAYLTFVYSWRWRPGAGHA